MLDPAKITARLRATGPGSPAALLATLLVEDALARPVGDLVNVSKLTIAVRDALLAMTASDAAAERIAERLDVATGELALEKRTLGAIVPKPLQDGARALAKLPTVTHRDAVRKLVDRDPIRKLLRAQVIDTLVAFGRKAASPVADNPLARGLGGLSKKLASRQSPLGALASAVSGEVERQLEARAADFADTAVEEIIGGIADQVSDPARAAEQAQLRAALVDGFLELTGNDLADLAKGSAKERVAAVRVALAAWVKEPTMTADIEAAVQKALAHEAARPLGDILADFAIRDVVAAHAKAALEEAIARFAATDAFAAWIASVLAP